MSDTNGTSEKLNEAQELAQRTADELKELRRELRKRADQVRVEVVKQLHNAAATIRKEARERQADQAMRENADKLAKGLEKTANYLSSRDIEQMGGDATETIRRNPWRTLSIIFVIGLLVGLFLRRED